MHLPAWATEILLLAGLLALVGVLVKRLPKVDMGHSPAFMQRRVMNWLPVGLTYAMLYMGRYNINATIGPLFTKKEYSDIYGVGALVYGLSFILNGPITDKLGGRKTIILSAVGACAANLGLGLAVGAHQGPGKDLVFAATVLYAVNMYFQSFGAVAIVKVNSAWFHLKERGTFGGIFGILIALGLYFAYDLAPMIGSKFGLSWGFYVPAMLLAIFAVLDASLVRDTPGEAGHADFALGDATADGPKLSPFAIATTMLKNPAIITIIAIEFCSGYLRNGIMQYYKPFAHELGRKSDFVLAHWGLLNCMAGISGSVVAGVISDRVFGSRRGPVAAVLYGVMTLGCLLMFPTLHLSLVGPVVVLMTLAIIGVHGMLSGTASMDFGGSKNTGIAVGIIDGFVYFGTASVAFVMGRVLPKDAAAHDAGNWWVWPAALLPVSLIGLLLSARIWNARPKSGAPVANPPPDPAPSVASA